MNMSSIANKCFRVKNLLLPRAATHAPTAPGSSPPQDVAAATRRPTMEVKKLGHNSQWRF